MALKATLTEDLHKTLPAHLQSEYKLDEKTKTYRLDVEPVGGWALEDVAGLKTVLSERTERHREAAAKVAAYGDLTPEQAREAVEKLKALGDMGDKAKLEKIIADMTGQVDAKYKGELAARDQQIAQLNQWAQATLIEAEAARLLSGSTNPSLKGSYELLIGVIRNHVKVQRTKVGDSEGFAVQIVDPKTGVPMLSQRQGNNGPMQMEEFLLTLRAQPAYAPAFAGSGSTGSGSAGSANGGSSNGADLSKLSPEARLAKLRERGAK